MNPNKTSKYISYLIAFALLVGAIASCKKNSSPASYTTNKAALLAAIDSLTTVYNSTVDGTKPGDYAPGARAALDSVIALATEVSTSTAYTQQQINNALNNLLAAGTTFTSQLIQQVSSANLMGYWEFNGNGLMARRIASINDLPIREEDRKYFWPLGRRPDDHPGLSELGL